MTDRIGSILFLLAIILLVSCNPKDDALEPNDDFSQATSLDSEKALKAIVLQNNSDVFSIEAQAGQKIVFTISAEEGKSPYNVDFSIHDPHGNSLQGFDCYRVENCQLQGDNIKITRSQDGAVLAFELAQQVNLSGSYYLTIRQHPDADNMFAYYWKYRLSAALLQP